MRDRGERRLPRPNRARDRSGGRQVASHPAESDGGREGEATGPLVGAVRAGRRHVPRDAAQRGRRHRVLGLRRPPLDEGREGPRRAHPGRRPNVPRGRAPVPRPIPRPGGNGLKLPDRTALGNGAVLISNALPSNPFVAFRGSVPAGVVAEGDAHGVAEFASRLLLSGTRRLGAAKLADRLEGIGATLEFHNGEEVLGFSGRCTRDSLRETIRILVDCLSHPTFPQREIDRVRGELLNDLRIEADDTASRAARELARFVFPNDHPYGRDPKGGADRVRRIRRRDLVDFHESRVGAEGLILAVTGDVDRELVEEAIAGPLSRLESDAEGIP
ncbi:MAG: insulinase family protein, partial [Methanobacteriota archaeon]